MGDVPLDPLAQCGAHRHDMLFVPFGVYQRRAPENGRFRASFVVPRLKPARPNLRVRCRNEAGESRGVTMWTIWTADHSECRAVSRLREGIGHFNA